MTDTPAPLPPPPELPAAALHSLSPETRSLLRGLAGQAWMDDFYLAGSAALALYAAHRPVRGLDFFAPANRLRSPHRRDLLQHLLHLDPELTVVTARDGFLYTRCGAGVPLRFFYYPYPLVAPMEPVRPLAGRDDAGRDDAGRDDAVRDDSGSDDREHLESADAHAELEVASPLDLALMKVAAIISRGTRRDFADLVLLSRHVPLATVLAWSAEKFGHVEDFPLQALKGLADLAQAPETPLPKTTPPLTWEDVESWVESEVRPLARRHVGLDGDGAG